MPRFTTFTSTIFPGYTSKKNPAQNPKAFQKMPCMCEIPPPTCCYSMGLALRPPAPPPLSKYKLPFAFIANHFSVMASNTL